MIDHKHPAVKAAQIGALGRPHHTLDAYANALKAALPHLTADDLRNTPAGRALMAEGWDRGAADNERAWAHAYEGHDVDPDDPLAECLTCCTPNPYREETPNE